MIGDSYAPYFISQRNIYGQRFSNNPMGYKEDLTSNPVRVDNVLDTIACLNTFPFKQNVNDAIVERLASESGT